MIKAGALLYAMFLVIVSSIISSSFILINYHNNTFVLGALKQEQLFRDVNSGINYGLSFNEEIPYNQKVEVNLFDDEQHHVTLYKKNWGAFYLLTSTAEWRDKTVSKTAFVGANIDDEKKIAVYLADQNKPLSLTGNTKISGNCYLPKAGVKRAYIEGHGFLGQKLIDGETRYSEVNLPSINKKLFEDNYANFSLENSTLDSIVDFALLLDNDTIINSFLNKTLVLYSPNSIVLENKYVVGNIKILSNKNITVKSSSKIDNIILYSKGIILEENTVANVQLYATDSISIEDNCKLSYPSVISVLGKGESKVQRKIVIGKQVKIKGVVFLVDENTIQTNLSKVAIGEKSEIMGYIYSSELLELNGDVIGGVYCKNFMLKTPSSIYHNHLMDVKIDRENLPKDFVGVALIKDIINHQTIRWVD
ncbi:MAG: hypothetical protein HYU68_13575 [Bacteroidetes bacterium]|nr:hypothetical protein [Bacteroidota bacterium]